MNVEFAVGDRGHAGAENGATASFGEEIVVEGTVVGSNGGTTAALRYVEYDPEDAAVSAAIEAVEDEDSGAIVTQALLGIEYRLAVETDDPVERVRVEHGGVEPWSTTVSRK